MKTDAISIVEAAYDLEGTTQAWVRRMLETVAPKLDRGYGVAISTYTPGMRPEDAFVDAIGMNPKVIDAVNAMMMENPETFHRVLNAAVPHSTPTSLVGLTLPEARTWPPYVKFLHPVGVGDLLGVRTRDPGGHSVFFSAPMPDVRRPTRSERNTWGRIASHIGAGFRLRHSAATLSERDVSQGAQAVLSPSGSLVHGEAEAQSADAREGLRRAVKSIDRARSKVRSNDDEALELWQGLVAGRWSLVDRFDTDGRRFIVARRNDPEVSDPRALTLRERQVLAFAALGHPLKLIAYSLGLSLGSVSATRTRAMRKLALRTQAQVVEMFAASAKSGA